MGEHLSVTGNIAAILLDGGKNSHIFIAEDDVAVFPHDLNDEMLFLDIADLVSCFDGNIGNAVQIRLADIGDATFVSSQSIVDRIEEAKANNELSTNVIEKEAETSGDNKVSESSGMTENSVNNEVDSNSVDGGDIVQTNANVSSDQSDYFINSKIDRDKMYSQMLEIYQNMLDNQNISSEQKAIATQEITKINNQKNGIMIAENLIKTKGMEDVVIFVNLDSISVVVKADVLETNQIAQIQNIVTRELEVEISNIHISTR